VLERVKFLAITANNLDEFVEVRVARLAAGGRAGSRSSRTRRAGTGGGSNRAFRGHTRICGGSIRLLARKALAGSGRESIRVRSFRQLNPEGRKAVDRFYLERVEPLMTPVTVDPAHPFPRVLNKALCVAFLLQKRRKDSQVYLGVVTVPRALPRVFRLPSAEGKSNSHFSARHRGGVRPAPVPRLQDPFLGAISGHPQQQPLSARRGIPQHSRFGRRAACIAAARARWCGWKSKPAPIPRNHRAAALNFRLAPWQVFQVDGPVNLSRLFNLYEQTPRPDLKFRPFIPKELKVDASRTRFSACCASATCLLHHPYDSYSTVVRFIESAAQDPDVLSIKQTLYRTSEDSPIVRALMEAASKKEVTVVVELKARFDEASNIRWARSLQEAGVQVYHGLVGLKTHCKLALLARRDPDGKDAPLRASGHRELQSLHGARLHRSEPADLR
jgi:polyphosphate kinase